MPTEVCIVKAMLFPVVMYACKSWADNKECTVWRTDVFELWCCRRLLRVPWTARRSNQSINLKGNQHWILFGRTDAEAPILWPPDANSWLIRKDLDAGRDWREKEKRARGWDGWIASLIQWTWTWANSRRWWGTGKSSMLQSMGLQSKHDLGDWTISKKSQRRTGTVCGTPQYVRSQG